MRRGRGWTRRGRERRGRQSVRPSAAGVPSAHACVEEAPWPPPPPPLCTQPTRGSCASRPLLSRPGRVQGVGAPSRARPYPRARSRQRARGGVGVSGLPQRSAWGPLRRRPAPLWLGISFTRSSIHRIVSWASAVSTCTSELNVAVAPRDVSPHRPPGGRNTVHPAPHNRVKCTFHTAHHEWYQLIYTKARVCQKDLGILGSKSHLIFAESYHTVLFLQQVLHLARHLDTAHNLTLFFNPY